ncbi:unnamed protein product [Cylicostephanus goldi]|uniref:Uncharacterized protein n=1 Tax=Cylicostephanus goldi TaxID=71465 RepID=A0A3P6R0G0_CYLGO|nr:unnamed protein product [Cylicostephanus goldi]
MPFSKMFCIDADLREILFAALSPKQKEFVDARQV